MEDIRFKFEDLVDDEELEEFCDMAGIEEWD